MNKSGSLLRTKLSSLVCATLALSLSGCVTEVVCRYPAPPAELVQPELPPPGYFQRKLREVVTSDLISPTSPTRPTPSSPAAGP